MSYFPRRHRGGFVRLTVFVFVSAGVLAGLFGLAASLLYGGLDLVEDGQTSEPVKFVQSLGLCWGAVTGLIAAAFWCWVIYRRVNRGLLTKLPWHGAGSGISAGLISTLLLHAALLVFGADRDPISLLFGLPIGVVAGLMLGVLSGMICQAIVNATPVEQSAREQCVASDAPP